MPQLDALRAFAILGVFVSHWSHWQGQMLPDRMKPFTHWEGPLGVRLFFVLSGFLISSILFRCRDRIETGDETRGRMLRRFYLRRILRIAPVYYATLAVISIPPLLPVRETLCWHATYLSNVSIMLSHHWDRYDAHLWSLAVEEQFYLLWPWLALFLPRKHLLKAIVLLIAVAPCMRLMSLLAGQPETSRLLVWHCLDTLLAGTLLAYCWRYPGEAAKLRSRLARSGLRIGLPVLLLVLASMMFTRLSVARYVFFDMAAAWFFVWLVDGAARGYRGVGGALLRWKPLVYLGKISYGMYLFHMFVPLLVQKGLQCLEIPHSPSLSLVLWTVVTVLLASVSWHLFERPINNLKRHFNYDSTTPSRSGSSTGNSPQTEPRWASTRGKRLPMANSKPISTGGIDHGNLSRRHHRLRADREHV
jgi:peptidoglycan/LPS O-acetylase OafA/YrhL